MLKPWTVMVNEDTNEASIVAGPTLWRLAGGMAEDDADRICELLNAYHSASSAAMDAWCAVNTTISVLRAR